MTTYLVDTDRNLIHVADPPDGWEARCGAQPAPDRSFVKPFPGLVPPGDHCQHCLHGPPRVPLAHISARNILRRSA